MEVLQWTMMIPQKKQKEFIKFYRKTLGPNWKRFGAIKFELYRLDREKISGQNSYPRDTFVERLYLRKGISSKSFFERVKADSEAWELSRSYEKTFRAKDIVLQVLVEP